MNIDEIERAHELSNKNNTEANMSDTPRTDRDDRPYPLPEYTQHIQFEGCDCVVMSPEDYEALYEHARQLERELAAKGLMRLWEVEMSETLRTEAVARGCFENDKSDYDAYAEMLNHARQLERELTTLRQQLADMTAANEDAEKELRKVKRNFATYKRLNP
jgi:hypothetical protein